VSSLGVKVGGRTVPEQPMEHTRTGLAGGREHAFAEGAAPAAASGPVQWDDAAADRLARVPSFVRGMVKRIYADWAKENGVAVMTTDLMDRARTELGLEGM
jgi:hypothetical protein